MNDQDINQKAIESVLQQTGARFSSFHDFDKAVDMLKSINHPKPIADYEKLLISVLEKITAEVFRAKSIHPNNFYNTHEGYAVIKEEIDELWDEIKINPKKENYSLFKIRSEAIQSAAMLVRFIVELT